jgi:protein-S-isoprenylcysteine O-methyltransferase Ste14
MKTKTESSKIKMLMQLVVAVIIMPLLPILIARRWRWWEAWVLALIIFLGFSISRLLASRKHPGILAERSNSFSRKDAKPWDKYLAPIMAFGGFFFLIISGLEERFNWSPEPYSVPVKIVAIAVLVSAYVFSSWAMIENAYFSGIVRIQTDRGHTVCSSGPYRFVRHPGYIGATWSYLAMPFLLDSKWSLIPFILLLVVTIVRTKFEDQTLQAELPGYREYASKVKYRLFPGIW